MTRWETVQDNADRAEIHALLTALIENENVKKRAAEWLGITFRKFRYLYKKHDIEEWEHTKGG